MTAPDLTELSGLELLRWMTAEGAPDLPSIGRLLGMRFDELERCAVHTTLPAGVGCATLQLKVNDVRAVQTSGETLTATGTVIHAGRRVATAEGRVVDDRDRLVAHATTTCLILPG